MKAERPMAGGISNGWISFGPILHGEGSGTVAGTHFCKTFTVLSFLRSSAFICVQNI